MTAKSDFPPRPGLTIRVCDRHGVTIRKSKNLAAVLRHASRHPVNVVEIRQLNPGYYGVAFHYYGGDSALTCFSDWRVALSFILARRSWSVERVSIDPELWPRATETRSAQLIRKRGTIVHARQ
jgi:hypothetical protein